jgi:hypothetical protein
MRAINLSVYRCRACHKQFYWPVLGDRLKDNGRTSRAREQAPAVQTTPQKTPSVPKPPKNVEPAGKWMMSKARFVVFGLVALVVAVSAYLMWVPASTHRSTEESIPRSTEEYVVERNVNRPGFDYTSFALREPRMELCAEKCMKDIQCKAFTFVRPAVQDAAGLCFLKSTMPPPVKDERCITGLKLQ